VKLLNAKTFEIAAAGSDFHSGRWDEDEHESEKKKEEFAS
jgi:hypothetical protein